MEKLKMGPIWDFNLAFGNVNYCNGASTEGWTHRFNEVCPNVGQTYLRTPYLIAT